MTVGSMFAGIGGFDLGFERAGFEIKWQVEIDPFCRRVLEKHWPHVRRYEDVRTIGSEIAAVDVLVGGFPCQPHSSAGRRLASADDRDLWPEYRRFIRAIKPRWFVAENVSGILSSDAGRFFGDVLRDVAESGYQCEWDSIPASAIGAPHKRDRVWLVGQRIGAARSVLADTTREQSPALEESAGDPQEQSKASRLCAEIPNTHSGRQQKRTQFNGEQAKDSAYWHPCWGHLNGCRCAAWWATEPNVGRVADGVSDRVDRLRGLGNAIVPQIAEWIARRILEAEGMSA